MNKWDLSKLYENDEAFEKDLYEIKSLIAPLSSFKGSLTMRRNFVSIFATLRKLIEYWRKLILSPLCVQI